MPKRPNPPPLMPPAARLLYICMAVICVYLLGVALYAAGDAPADALRRDNAFELLRGAYIASVLALGGALVLDLDARRAERR